MNNGMILLLDGARGQFIPRDFALCINTGKFAGISKEDLEILKAGPDHEYYWAAWEDVLNNAFHIDADLNKWFLWQDGDLWMYCEELLSDADKVALWGWC